MTRLVGRHRQVVLIAIAIFAVLAVFVAIVTRRPDGPEETVSKPAGGDAQTPDQEATAGKVLATELYFPGTGGWLQTERREVPASTDSVEQISVVVSHLLAGPRDSGMRAPLPEGVSVRKVYLPEDRLAFVDFESADSTPPASGSLREMLTVYSLVNTVVLNFEQIDRVVLLWNGRQLRTFAGHVDTMRPLAPNTDLVARDASGATP